MQAMILASNRKDRERYLERLLPLQKQDFIGLYREMKGLSRHHPAVGSALARVFAETRTTHGGYRQGRSRERAVAGGRGKTTDVVPGRRVARIQSHAGTPGLSPGHYHARDHAHAGAGDYGRPLARWAKEGKKIVPEIMIPLVGMASEMKAQKGPDQGSRRGKPCSATGSA